MTLKISSVSTPLPHTVFGSSNFLKKKIRRIFREYLCVRAKGKPNFIHARFTFLSERDKAILLRLVLPCAFVAWYSLSPVSVRRRRSAPLVKKPANKTNKSFSYNLSASDFKNNTTLQSFKYTFYDSTYLEI